MNESLSTMLCGLVAAFALGSAQAAPLDGAEPAVVVHYRPASLATDAGAQALYRRLVSAAEQACPVSPGSKFVTRPVQECREQALGRAVQAVGSPALAAVHAGILKRG